jgi:hypothetical protein
VRPHHVRKAAAVGLCSAWMVLACAPQRDQVAEKARDVAAKVKARLDGYCDARQKAIDAIGDGGAP